MRSLTIAQRREAQLHDFNERYIKDLDTAKKIVNSYYRFVALSMRVDELETEETQNKPWYKALEAKKNRWYKRLDNYLKPYNLCLCRPWCCENIVRKGKNGTVIETALYAIFYK